MSYVTIYITQGILFRLTWMILPHMNSEHHLFHAFPGFLCNSYHYVKSFAPYLIHQKVSVLKSKTIDLSTENFNKEILKQGDFNILKNVIPQAVSLLVQLVWHHPFSKYVKCSKKLTFLTPWSVRNGGKRWGFFSENLAYLLNGWSLSTDVLTGDSDLFDT